MKFILAKNGGAFNPARVDYFAIDDLGKFFGVKAVFESRTFNLEKFDTEDEAKNYIAQIVADLNKPAARWIKTCCGDTVNLDIFGRFEILKHIGAGREEYCVVAYGKYDGEKYTLQVFNTEDDAQKYLDDLLEKMNGAD